MQQKASLVSDSQPRFQDVSARVDFPALDARILAFWKEHRIFEKSLEGRDDAPLYVFYEGPPTANGRPGAHHVISRIFKDLFPRYKTMRGYRVPRKAGWDTHGLPVELEVERRLGIDGKQQIEAYGVAEFNQLCRESVTAYLEEWVRFTERIGFWLDLDDAYYTFTNDYIESVWWILRQIWDKGLLYQGHKVVPYCPRCGTAISSHEVAQGYKDVTEDSIYVRFPLTAEAAARVAGEAASADADGEPKRVSLAVWTTTPWTLISNVAAAVHPDVAYALVESRGERFILARELVEKVLGKRAEVLREFAGAELLGLEYEAPFGFMPTDKRAHFVIGGDYVTTTDGTGIVHIAPAFGEEDMRVGMENDLPVVNAVDLEGKFVAEVTPWAGVYVKDADPAIIADLKERGLLLGVEPYEHSYPFCWRCDTALLYYAKATWYVRTTAIKDQLLKANDDVIWHPEHIKTGRFGEWLAGNVDWALSRDRYWGTPLPVWRCEEGHTHCVGSIEELRELAAGPVPEDLELHRPYVDDVVLTCPDCAGEMRRVPGGHRCLVRLRLDALRAVALPVRERRPLRGALPGRLHLRGHRPDARLVLQPHRRGHADRGPQLLQARALPRAHPRRRRPEDEQEQGQRRGAGRHPRPSGRRRVPLVHVREPAAVESAPLRPRDGRRGRAQVPAHAVEHLQLLHPVREHRPLRSGDPGVAAAGAAAGRPLARRRAQRARPGTSPPASRPTTRPAPAAPSSSSSTTSATGTCAAAGVASGRARATPTSWPPTTRCTRRSSR